MTIVKEELPAIIRRCNQLYPGVRAPSKWSGDEVQPLYEEGYERKQVAISLMALGGTECCNTCGST